MTVTTPSEPLLLPSEAAREVGVNAKTLTRWAKDRKIRSTKTLGGHRRYRLSELQADIAAERARRDEAEGRA